MLLFSRTTIPVLFSFFVFAAQAADIPAPPAEAPKVEIQDDSIPVGPALANCHLVWIKGETEALLVDPGDDSPRLIKWIERHQLKPVAILLTHAHPDHLGAAGILATKYGIPLWVNPEERELYDLMVKNMPRAKLPEPVKKLPEIKGLRVTVLPLPGHSPAGVGFYFPDAGMVLCGDTLFKGSIGRTDLPGGDQTKLIRVIREQLLVLPEKTIVHPGHGDSTTVGKEAKSNPFLK